MPLFRKKERSKSKVELIAEELIAKIGKEKLDEEATKLYFQGIRDLDEQMRILAERYQVEVK